MFKPKSKIDTQVEVLQKHINTKAKYSNDIEIIHNEFNIAGDNIIEEAYKIINSTSEAKIDKIKTLESLGFTQAVELVKGKEEIKKLELSKEQVSLIAYYKSKYPFNKFITEDQVRDICFKYRLVCGEVSRYTGFVPQKNLNEISNSNIKDEDKLKNIVSIKTFGEDIGRISNDDGERARDYKNIYRKDFVNKPLFICAPVDDMIVHRNERIENNKIVSIPDPVVLHVVPNGYLIVSKWGLPDESNQDTDLINETMN